VSPTATFRYLRDPRAQVVSTWRDEPHACGLCGRSGPGYDGPYYGESDCDFVCEPCLVTGRLAHYGLSTNTGAPAALRLQLVHLPEVVRERLVRGRTEELEHRTPRLVTWQDLIWPACCGDYVRFEGEVGREELARLAGGGDAWRWFLDHVLESRQVSFTAEALPPHASRPAEQWSLAVYHFRCTSCGKDLLHWDCS
jgi:uncharacterized protein CbrC (UPF0167 family)